MDLSGVRTSAGYAALFGLWWAAFHCRLEAYYEVVRRIDERPAGQKSANRRASREHSWMIGGGLQKTTGFLH